MLYDDPDLYDALLPASAAQLDYYLNLARQRAGAVLALACGSGQLIVPVASMGSPATGPRSVIEDAVGSKPSCGCFLPRQGCVVS
jgi:hypothetical protein